MPNTTSAKKAYRASERKRLRNIQKKKALRIVLKKYGHITASKNAAEARTYFPLVQKALDKAAKSGIISRNTASRKKSRLSKLTNA